MHSVRLRVQVGGGHPRLLAALASVPAPARGPLLLTLAEVGAGGLPADLAAWGAQTAPPRAAPVQEDGVVPPSAAVAAEISAILAALGGDEED